MEFDEYRTLLNEALDTVDEFWLNTMYREIFHCATYGRKILVCGNGGSAAIAEHLSCDHTKGVAIDTNLIPNVISLGSNMSIITAIANDIGYEHIFSKQIEWNNS